MERNPAYSLQTLLLLFLSVVVCGVLLSIASSIVIPLVVAWFLSYLLYPVTAFLHKRLRLPNVLAVALTVVALLALLYGAGNLIENRIYAFARKAPAYAPRVRDLYVSWGERFHVPRNILSDLDLTDKIVPWVTAAANRIASLATKTALVVFYLVFMLVARPFSRNKLRAAFPENAEAVQRVVDAISVQISAYLGSLFFISLVTGLAVWGVLAWLGVEFAFTWGLLAFLLNFIPTLGSIVSTVPPVVLAAVQGPGLALAAKALVALVVIQNVLGNVVAPKLYGDRLDLSPVTILVSLVFWGWLWGVTGTLLSVPIAAAMQIALSNIPQLKGLAILMGNGKHCEAAREENPPRRRPRRRRGKDQAPRLPA
ncbi:MAG: AI-2E family transporter [Kiritimatiellae bacterium]|nr:AI-2E family transporter [Kiritimatiellia bacterium]